MRWFHLEWYKYLFTNLPNDTIIEKGRVILCRMKGHPAGPVWFTSTGTEPDMTCNNCGDDL
jgi:hypothetical protein